jgi:hypothetical protein
VPRKRVRMNTKVLGLELLQCGDHAPSEATLDDEEQRRMKPAKTPILVLG